MRHHQSIAVLTRSAGVAALLLSFSISNAVGLNDTGITTCSNANQNGLPCPVAGFPRQDAEFGSNVFTFTKLDAAGNELPASATDHVCVRDNVTRLVWQVYNSNTGYTVNQAIDYVENVNAAWLCGFNDWRLPEVKELSGIVDYYGNYSDPTLDSDAFPNAPNSWFWTGSSYSGSADSFWYVYFSDGDVNYGDPNYSLYVRPVRGGRAIDTFIDNGDGTVTQSYTGLMWAKCSAGQTGNTCAGAASEMVWSEALNAAYNSRLGGYSDWRLPNLKELQALVNETRIDPAIDTTAFPNTPSAWFWSSSPYSSYWSYVWNEVSYVWNVNFYDGDFYNNYQYNFNHARFVRGGQPFTSFDLSVAKKGSGTGTVTSSPAGISCGTTCVERLGQGAAITLIATPDATSNFGGWSGACTNKTSTCIVNMSKAQTVTATFAPLPNDSLTVSTAGSGSVTSSPAGIRCGTACSKAFISGTAVTLTATATAGAIFSDWAGCTPLVTNPLQCKVILNGKKSITATFGTADMIVTAIALTPVSPAANSAFTAKITVKNQGTVSANGGYMDVWAHQAAKQGCGADGEQWLEIGVLAAGATKTFTVSLPAQKAGNKTLRALVDSWCQLPETNEMNNEFTTSYTVK
ncbi:hypothetical protein CKO12_04295 [Chromatium okenii]|uniref:Lcl domain-containing protein n=1 Tax=Chromatium okenii TaxID=61644 RepID=UPI001906E729|nr:DUF1566 domain-containing protein [Chromatium okenii]MBK1641105.1 hypothetical protein [Chromatium okenii]